MKDFVVSDKAIKSLDTIHWYNAELIKLYINEKSFRKVSKLTGIPVSVCYEAIKKGMKLIDFKPADFVNEQIKTMQQQLFTRNEVAEIFQIKPRTIWHWEQKGWIKPCGYISTRPRYSLEEIERVGKDIQRLKWAPDKIRAIEDEKIIFGQKAVLASLEERKKIRANNEAETENMALMYADSIQGRNNKQPLVDLMNTLPDESPTKKVVGIAIETMEAYQGTVKKLKDEPTK